MTSTHEGGESGGSVLLFDVMGTLVSDPFPEAARSVLGVAPEDLGRLLDFGTLLEWEQGEIDEAACIGRLFVDRRPVDLEALKAQMLRSCQWLPGMEELLAELRRRHVVMHALSDYSRWYQLVEQALGLSRYLPWTFVSCVTGTCKPAPAAFLEPARALGVAPAQCILIDDKPGNCEAARAVGLVAIPLRDAARLRAELGALGIA